jgi:hypothetical protein
VDKTAEVEEVKFYWTKVKNHKGGTMISNMEIDSKLDLDELLKRGMSMREFQREMTAALWSDDFFRTSDLWFCGEIVFPCILVFDELKHTYNVTKPMITLMNMSLLTLFPWSDISTLDGFLQIFIRVVSDSHVHLGVACRVVLEQIRWQTGVSLDYVPFQSFFVDSEISELSPPKNWGSGRKFLVYRNNLYHLNNFHVFLRRLYEANKERLNFELHDMNEAPGGTTFTFQDMAEFDGIILLSYIPNALRLTDALALGRAKVFTGSKDLANKFIWMNQPFGGLLAPEHWRHGLGGAAGREEVFPEGRAWSEVRAMEKMWKKTEWARTKGLTYFDSVPDLLMKLNASEVSCESDLKEQRRRAGKWWKKAVGETLREYRR